MIITIGHDIANRRLGTYGKPGCEYVYIPILKNAHTWGIKFFQENGEFIQDTEPDYGNSISNKKFIIFLRDPVERWYSGVAQYFDMHMDLDPQKEYILDKNMLKLISNAVRLDGHTDLQINYFLGLRLYDCTFFDIGSKEFEFQLKLFTQRKNIHKMTDSFVDVEPINQSKNYILKTSIIEQLKYAAKNDTNFLSSVIQFYRPDMQLFVNLKKYFNNMML